MFNELVKTGWIDDNRLMAVICEEKTFTDYVPYGSGSVPMETAEPVILRIEIEDEAGNVVEDYDAALAPKWILEKAYEII